MIGEGPVGGRRTILLECGVYPGTSASGQLRWDADARLHARGAVASDDDFLLLGLTGITRFAPPDARGPFRRPPPVAPRRDRCVRRGMRAARRAYPWLARAGRRVASDPAASASAHVTGMPTRSRHARGAGAPGDTFRLAEIGVVGSPEVQTDDILLPWLQHPEDLGDAI